MLVVSGNVLMRCYGITREEIEAAAVKVSDNMGMVAYTMPIASVLSLILCRWLGAEGK